MILGIDAGNYETKVCNGKEVMSFPSDIGEYRERKLIDSFSKDDMIWEYKGEKGFAGTLAKYESEFGGTIKGKTKAHKDAIIRILIAIHKYGEQNNHIVVGQPIDTHYEEEKNKIKQLLLGKHEFTINNVSKIFNIDRIEIAPEGSSSILSNPSNGLIRVIDIGSGTTNFATLDMLRKIDRDSFTEQFGTETTKVKNSEMMAMKIVRIISGKWDINDDIYLTGGGAEKVYPHIKQHLLNSKVLRPKLGNKIVKTKYANVIGFYKIAEGLFNNV